MPPVHQADSSLRRSVSSWRSCIRGWGVVAPSKSRWCGDENAGQTPDGKDADRAREKPSDSTLPARHSRSRCRKAIPRRSGSACSGQRRCRCWSEKVCPRASPSPEAGIDPWHFVCRGRQCPERRFNARRGVQGPSGLAAHAVSIL
jgi:hypothetical protein